MFEFLDKLPAQRRELFARIVAVCFDAKLKDKSRNEILKHILRLIEESASKELRSAGVTDNAD
jgi:DNA-binding ferritin-like protein (Dps family)